MLMFNFGARRDEGPHMFSTGWPFLTAVVPTPSQTSTARERMTLTTSVSGGRCSPGRRFLLSLKPARNSATGTDRSPIH